VLAYNTATLPKAEHAADEWQAAMQALLLVADHDGPAMFDRIGVMIAFHRLRRTSEKCPELTLTSRSDGIGFTFRS
jgi:hypothetical protein